MNWLKRMIDQEIAKKKIQPIIYWPVGEEVKILLEVPKGIFIDKRG